MKVSESIIMGRCGFGGDYRRDLLDISQVLSEAGSAIIDVCAFFPP
jgi:hypothetical protein